jgi:ketosteroid isomerase-like protein
VVLVHHGVALAAGDQIPAGCGRMSSLVKSPRQGMTEERKTREELNADVVRRLWSASSRHGTEAALALLDKDAEWRLHILPERILTTDELADILLRLERNRRVTAAHLSRVIAEGDFVFAAGSFRWAADDGSLIDFHGYWVYELTDGKLVRGQSLASREDAMQAFREAVATSAL